MDYTGSIYRLIDRAEDEMKEYVSSALTVMSLSFSTR